MSRNSKNARKIALRKIVTASHKNGNKIGCSTRKHRNVNGWAHDKDENGRLRIFAERDANARRAEQQALKEEQAANKAAAKAERERMKKERLGKRGRLDD